MQKPDECNGCIWNAQSRRFTASYGPATARVCFLTSTVSNNDTLNGRPLSEGMGRVYHALCKDAGVLASDLCITSATRCWVSNGFKDKHFLPAAYHCTDKFFDRVMRDFPAVEVIIASGAGACAALLGVSSIAKYRGGVYEITRGTRTYRVVPTFDVSTAIKEGKAWPVIVSDIQYAVQHATTHTPKIQNFILRPTVSDVEAWFSTLPQDAILFCDIETYGNALACIGFASDEHNAICIPLWELSSWYWGNFETASHVLRIVADALANPAFRKVFHNGKFDIPFLERFGFTISNWHADTMIMHHTIYSELRHSLAFLHSVYVRDNYYKDMGRANKDGDDIEE